jgi:hypothetical protein
MDYETLGLEPGASRDAVRKAYRKLCLRYHPDKTSEPGATQKFIDITDAYTRIMAATPNAPTTESPRTMSDMLVDSLSSYVRTLLQKQIPTPAPVVIPITVTLEEVVVPVPVIRKCMVRVARRQMHELVPVYVSVGTQWKSTYVYPGMGDEDMFGRRGDIHVAVTVTVAASASAPHAFRVEDDNLVLDVPLTLAEYVDGCTTHVMGREVTVPDLVTRDAQGCVTSMPLGGATMHFSISSQKPHPFKGCRL